MHSFRTYKKRKTLGRVKVYLVPYLGSELFFVVVLFSSMGPEEKRISVLQLEESFCVHAPPSSLIYLLTDRVFKELRQRVFSAETEISSEPKPVEAEAPPAQTQVGWAWGRGPAPRFTLPLLSAFSIPGCFLGLMISPELRGHSQDFRSCHILGRNSAFSSFPERQLVPCSLGFLSHVVFSLGF